MTVHLNAELEGSPMQQSVEMTLPKQDATNPQIDRMWAWRRVDRLMADARSMGGSNTNQEEIVRLCEGYSIVSQYASFLVLENDAEYKRWRIERRNAARIERDRAAMARLRDELRRIQTDSAADLGPNAKPGRGSESSVAARSTPSTPARSNSASPPTPTNSPSTSRDVSFAPPISAPNVGGGGGGFGGVAADDF